MRKIKDCYRKLEKDIDILKENDIICHHAIGIYGRKINIHIWKHSSRIVIENEKKRGTFAPSNKKIWINCLYRRLKNEKN